jgi:type IV secretion system protein TrbI
LAKLPKSYAEVPVLGPPVPGDIGRAFVEGEKRLGLQLPAPETSIKPNPEEEAERAERIRQARIAQQARESSLFFHLFDKQKRWPSVAPDQGSPAPQPAALRPPVADERGPVAIAIALTRAFQGPGVCSSELLSLSQARKLAFVGGKVDKETINPHALTIQPSPYTLLAGSIISASLITGVSSDLPGQVVAQVSENAYNTVTGEHLLIPQGTRLIGKLTAWSRSARDAHYWCGPASSYRTATRS